MRKLPASFTTAALLLWASAFGGPLSATAGITVVGELSRSHKITPDGSFEGVILVRNNDDAPAEVKAFQTDYLFFADGRNLHEDAENHRRSNRKWISISPARLSIPGKSSAEILYRGRVSADTNLSGSYWSLVIIEPFASPAPVLTSEPKKITVGLNTTVRYAVQIVTEIGDTGARMLKVANKRLIKGDGQRTFELDVENTGERLQIPVLSMELFNGNGASVAKLDGGKFRIYPTCSVRYRVNLMSLPSGKYTALAILDNGDDHVTGAQYQLEF